MKNLMFQMFWGIAAIGIVWLTLSLFAFLLPFVLVLMLFAFGLKMWRMHQLKKIFEAQNDAFFETDGKKTSSGRKKAGDIIDVEYEIIRDDYKTNKSE